MKEKRSGMFPLDFIYIRSIHMACRFGFYGPQRLVMLDDSPLPNWEGH